MSSLSITDIINDVAYDGLAYAEVRPPQGGMSSTFSFTVVAVSLFNFLDRLSSMAEHYPDDNRPKKAQQALRELYETPADGRLSEEVLNFLYNINVPTFLHLFSDEDRLPSALKSISENVIKIGMAGGTSQRAYVDSKHYMEQLEEVADDFLVSVFPDDSEIRTGVLQMMKMEL